MHEYIDPQNRSYHFKLATNLLDEYKDQPNEIHVSLNVLIRANTTLLVILTKKKKRSCQRHIVGKATF